MYSTATKRIIEPNEWLIVPSDSEESIDLLLRGCTSVLAFTEDANAQYIVAHSDAIGSENSRKFKEVPESENRISLVEVMEIYLRQINDYHVGSIVGVYVFSGMRTSDTDLSIVRYFSSNGRYLLKGAELNRPVKIRIKPLARVVQFFVLSEEERPIRADYHIGRMYDVNLRNHK